jgi:hypothetical protein
MMTVGVCERNMRNLLSRSKFIVDTMILLILCSFAGNITLEGMSVSSGRTFSGAVYANGGEPISGAIVTAVGPEGYGHNLTNPLGQYSISEGLLTGNYTVNVLAEGYLLAEVENVSVTAEMTTSPIDFYLALSGGISGRVTEAGTGLPLQNVMISAFNPSNTSYGYYAFTDSNGNYQIAANLATGTYNVSVPFPEGHIMKSISGIAVAAGTMTAGQDIVLEQSGIVSGRVTAVPSGSPLEDATIKATSDDLQYTGTAQTNATGHYRIDSGLGTGNYSIMALYGSDFLSTDVTVVAGTETPNVNFGFTVSPPPPSGIIMGKVTDIDDDMPIANVLITAQDSGFGQAYTDDNGEYVISSGLTNGTYTLSLEASGYTPQSMAGVVVTEGLATPNMDFQLSKIPPEQSGTISGTVTGDPNPIPELQHPMIAFLIFTAMAVSLTKLFNAKARRNKQSPTE